MEESTLNPNIVLPEGYNLKQHSKASEEYLSVEFIYDNYIWKGWVPVTYRRTGTYLKDQLEINRHLNKVYSEILDSFDGTWLKKQQEFWHNEKPKATTTKSFFDALNEGNQSEWKCVNCQLPNNPNWARRIQDLKEFGYTLATNTNAYCDNCNANKTHLMLLPIARGGLSGNGYETWSSSLRKRILNVLNNYDVYECRTNTHLLPDHKFPEIRWDDATKGENPDTMTDREIRDKFQLISNQRNQQKREVCRNCYQTDQRGTIYGIKYFYKGGAIWDNKYPRTGKQAEQGCVGCGWYDIEKWRESIVNKIKD